MKTKILLINLIILACINAYPQELVTITTENKDMSQGSQMAFSVLIPEANIKLVENEWKKFINERSVFEFATKGTSQTIERAVIGLSNLFSKNKKEYTKESLKVEKINGEFVVRNVVHEQVTHNHIDVFAQITETGNGVELSSFFRYSDSIFINRSNADENTILTLSNYIQEFGKEAYVKEVENQVFNERKDLRKEEGTLKALENKNKSMHSSIGKLETNIDECHNTIRIIEKGMEQIEEEIAENKGLLRGLNKRTEAYKIQKEVLKQSEKNYRKEFRGIKDQNSKIKRLQSRIRNHKADILINEGDQERQRKVIEEQKTQLEKVKEKLATISK